MNEPKEYIVVQDVTRENLGHRTYTDHVTKVTMYEMKDIKKAISHFKKRAHNDIIYHIVNFYDKAPYARTTSVFGHKHCQFDLNTNTTYDYVVFEDKKLGIHRIWDINAKTWTDKEVGV